MVAYFAIFAQIFLYNGDDGAKVSELTTAAETHTGSIFSLSWSADSKQLLSSSADCTTKLWDIGAGSVVQTWKATDQSEVGDQQVGNWWKGDFMISVSLRGDINYLSKESATPTKVVRGHQRPITALAPCSSDTFVSGSSDGRILKWSVTDGLPTALSGTGHTNQVTGLAASGNTVVSTGMDDSARFIDVAGNSFRWVGRDKMRLRR